MLLWPNRDQMTTSKTVRTPDEAFASIPDYPFSPNYFDWSGIRLHYVDEGEGYPVILFHGEPTWSFLYRRMIPVLVSAGYRAIAPDYPGFGKSDKPTDDSWYSYDRHTEAMRALLRSLSLGSAAVVGQDWGGPISLRLAVEEDWINRIVILNTGLFTGGGQMPDAWFAFREFVKNTPDLPVGFIMSRSEAHPWGADVISAYDAPFPGPEFKAGVRSFPALVPIETGDPGASEMKAVAQALGAWQAPALVLFSTGDPIFSTRVGQGLVEQIPGAEDLQTIDDAAHFLQEDQGPEVARRIVDFLDRTL